MNSSGGHVAAGLTAAAFFTLAGVAIVWGLAHVLIGVPLRRQRPGARLLALMAGSIDLLIAVVAIHHQAELVTFDSDFEQIAHVCDLQVKLLHRPAD